MLHVASARPDCNSYGKMVQFQSVLLRWPYYGSYSPRGFVSWVVIAWHLDHVTIQSLAASDYIT
jgi:hypothetical protein